MPAAMSTSSLAESAALQYSDMETVRRRLIELEKNRIFSDEDLALLVRKSASTNLKADFDHRMFNHKMRRTASDRTSSGRLVIRSWKPIVLEGSNASTRETEGTNDITNDGGWKQFQPPQADSTAEIKVARLSVGEIRSNIRASRVICPTKLKRMQNRHFVVTILANLIFVPRQICSDWISSLVDSARNRAC